jgi:hypothetical protein
VSPDRLRHDSAWRLCRRLVLIVAPALREEEQAECFREFLPIIPDELVRYEAQRQRHHQRLHPRATHDSE